MSNAQNTTGTPTIDGAFEQVRDLGDQVVASSRKAGNAYVDSYEKTIESALELELKVAGMTQQEWLKNLIETQAEFARQLTHSYTTAARALLK